MDIVSLAPSATETILELDAETELVASVATRNVPSHVDTLGGWLTTPTNVVADYDPDLVITTDALQTEQREALAGEYPVLHLDPRSLSEVLDSIQTLSTRIGYAGAGDALVETLTERLETVRENQPEATPVVYCEEWSTPPMVAGNWIPDVISVAGGAYPFLDSGVRSQSITQREFEQHDPDIAILHICGRGTDPSTEQLTTRDWRATALPEDVYVVDDSLLNNPSPLLMNGVQHVQDILKKWAKSNTGSAPR